MLIATATLPTDNASKYIAQLCKHFAHKIEVSWDENTGRITLPTGRADLTVAPGALTIRVEAEDVQALIQCRYVIDKHLAIFAFREGFMGFDWRNAADAMAGPADGV